MLGWVSHGDGPEQTEQSSNVLGVTLATFSGSRSVHTNLVLSIRKYLHLADNSVVIDNKTSNPDRLAKIRPLLNLLLQNFHSNYRPNPFLAVDEDMCKFKGRNLMKQYMRAKIGKWGPKSGSSVISLRPTP